MCWNGLLLFCLTLAALAAQPAGDWRQVLSTLPAQPGPNTTPQDIQRLRGALSQATPYLLSTEASDYEANREMVRRIVAYLAAAELVARDPEMRLALAGAYRDVGDLQGNPQAGNLGFRTDAMRSYRRSGLLYGGVPRGRRSDRQMERELDVLGTRMALLGIPFTGFSDANGPPPPGPVDRSASPPAAPAEPPFPMLPPAVKNVPEKDKAEVEDLNERYTSAASKAMTALDSGETLRRNLAAQGMSLNADLAASLARVGLYLQLAAESFESRDWAAVRLNIERADATSQKILRSFGR